MSVVSLLCHRRRRRSAALATELAARVAKQPGVRRASTHHRDIDKPVLPRR